MQGNFDFISALVENIRIDDYQLAIETILLISTLSQNNDLLKHGVSGNKKISAFMNAFIEHYKVSYGNSIILTVIESARYIQGNFK